MEKRFCVVEEIWVLICCASLFWIRDGWVDKVTLSLDHQFGWATLVQIASIIHYHSILLLETT